MDRQIEYPGEILTEVELLTIQRNIYQALGYLAQLAVGLPSASSAIADGFACTPQSSPNLTVQVAPGAVYVQQPIDGMVAYSSLGTDANVIVKQGINLTGAAILSCPPPAIAGQSINYLVEVGFTESDGPIPLPVLQYFNASNPAIGWSGPNNTGTAQPTTRFDGVTIQLKAGTAAATGSQTTPAPDSGFVGLWVVTVANGASAITGANITAFPGSPLINSGYKYPSLPATLQSQPGNYAIDTGTANNYAVSLSPTPAAWASLVGAPIRFKVTNTNTSSTCFLNVNGLGNKALTNSDGSAILVGALVAGAVIEGLYDGSNVQIARSAMMQLAQCRLSAPLTVGTPTATTITLAPYGGNRLLNPASGTQTIPSAGITATSTSCFVNGAASSALQASTSYWIYEFSNAGTPTLDFCATTWTTDVNTGMPIKTGDNTRVLVGRCTTNSAAQFALGRVLSYWNRRSIGLSFISNSSTSSTTYTATSTTMPVECWGDEGVSVTVNAQGSNSTSGNGGGIQLFVDGASVGVVSGGASIGAGTLFNCSCTWAGTLSEGSHIIAMAAAVYIGGTFTWNNSTVSVVTRG